jgi:coenzyme F420-0:L-glutamate ligase/coenzyme F420-1:gamma-L-glutamate ligase
LTVSGFDPLISQIDTPDLFGTPLKMTHEATADQLATAANFLMGNADESTPAVVIRDHGLPLTDFHGWVPGIARKDDLFAGLL